MIEVAKSTRSTGFVSAVTGAEASGRHDGEGDGGVQEAAKKSLVGIRRL
jgi:hypothetical protein